MRLFIDIVILILTVALATLFCGYYGYIAYNRVFNGVIPEGFDVIGVSIFLLCFFAGCLFAVYNGIGVITKIYKGDYL